MRRPWQIWLMFAGCTAVAAAAVGWLTLHTLDLHRREVEARQHADLEEKVRLALWRMDSALSPLIIRESARPPEAYSAAPLLAPPGTTTPAEHTSHVLLYFEVDPSGELLVSEALNADIDGIGRDGAASDPREFLGPDGDGVAWGEVLALLPEPPASVDARGVTLPDAPPSQSDDAVGQQAALSNNEYNVRAQLATNNGILLQQQVQQYASPFVTPPQAPRLEPTGSPAPEPPPESPGAVRIGGMEPMWRDGRLLLMRKVVFGSDAAGQGCVLDWPAIRADLLTVVADLLPEADLEPVLSTSEDPAHRLAILPVRLLPGRVPAAAGDGTSPVWLSLLVTWGSLLFAAAAAAVVLRGVVALSERRAAFVTAVTHELRTPLTTFRLYAEMLAEGMVSDESRTRYLATLQSEADRLMHLVENVLSYARLERNPAGIRAETLTAAELLQPVMPRLEERAARGGFELLVAGEEEAMKTPVSASPSAVEQILLNLVDNACKYAVPADDKRLHLTIHAEDRHVRLRLRDHGPGISQAVRRRLFSPFHKSAHDAAGTAPGVGLGLAFSRRLARSMRGDLRLDSADRPGATFVLSLPRASRPTITPAP